MYIIGKTGTGKTTLLDNMTVQDIAHGNGVAVIDPHGEYAERMLAFVPQNRIQDVVYFNPADLDYPFGFNMLEQPKAEMRHFVASGLMSVFKKLWVDAWSARMEYFLSNSILSHLEMPDSTLMGVHRIFGDKAYRRSLVLQLQDPVLKAFWENEFDKLPEQFMREAVAAIQNKVGQFIANPLIRNIIGQPRSTFNIREIMDSKKILIANLAKGRIGEENSKLLGAMLVTRIYLAAMSRVDVPEDAREDFYVYVDEFQNFATESFASILSEARKYRLNLTLANQYMAQLVDDKTKSAVLRDAIIGNVGSMISFRIGAEDAEVLEKEFAPEFLIQDFVNLGFANVYLKLMIDNVASRPFSAVTLAPIDTPTINYAKEIIDYSRLTYGRSREVVDQSIRDWGGFAMKSGASVFSGVPVAPRPVPHVSARDSSNASVINQAPTAAVSPPAVASVARPIVSKDENGQKMYRATCAIDGQEIWVPFQPDGRRPVYCSEHLSQIQRGQGQSQNQESKNMNQGSVATSALMPAGEGEKKRKRRRNRNRNRHREGAASSHTQAFQSAPVVRTSDQTISLRDLSPKNDSSLNTLRKDHEPRPPMSPKKPVDLGELRKVLQETITRSAPQTPPPDSQNERESGTLKPGESIKF